MSFTGWNPCSSSPPLRQQQLFSFRRASVSISPVDLAKWLAWQAWRQHESAGMECFSSPQPLSTSVREARRESLQNPAGPRFTSGERFNCLFTKFWGAGTSFFTGYFYTTASSESDHSFSTSLLAFNLNLFLSLSLFSQRLNFFFTLSTKRCGRLTLSHFVFLCSLSLSLSLSLFLCVCLRTHSQKLLSCGHVTLRHTTSGGVKPVILSQKHSFSCILFSVYRR